MSLLCQSLSVAFHQAIGASQARAYFALDKSRTGNKKNIQAGTRILMMVKGHSSVGCMLFKNSIGRLDLLHDYIFWPL